MTTIMRMIAALVFFFMLTPSAEAEWKLSCKTDRMTDVKSCALFSVISNKDVSGYLNVFVYQTGKFTILFTTGQKFKNVPPFMLRVDKEPALRCKKTCDGDMSQLLYKSLLKGNEIAVRDESENHVELSFPLTGFSEKHIEAIKFLEH